MNINSQGSIINSLYNLVRVMAKSNKYQTLYHNSKEGVTHLFLNYCEYTQYQIIFLQYLSFYSSLNTDVYMDEVDEIVLEDDIYADAYQYYKNEAKKKNRIAINDVKPTNKKTNNPTVSNTHVVFSRAKPKI